MKQTDKPWMLWGKSPDGYIQKIFSGYHNDCYKEQSFRKAIGWTELTVLRAGEKPNEGTKDNSND